MSAIARPLPDRVLCLVTDLRQAGSEADLLRTVAAAVDGGVNMLQVRAHELDDDGLAALATGIVEQFGDRAVVVVNGPADVALRSGAHGVHVREQAEIDRSMLPPDMLVGQSVHSVESARKAEAGGADYIILGTVFPSGSHPGGATGGTDLVAAVAGEVSIPVIGIGGITQKNAGDVIAAGASGVAVISAIIGADDPLRAAEALATAVGAE